MGATSLADSLRLNFSITDLNVSQCFLNGDAAAISLALALRVNTSITRVAFESNRIGVAGAAVLADTLRVNKFITQFNIGDNHR